MAAIDKDRQNSAARKHTLRPRARIGLINKWGMGRGHASYLHLVQTERNCDASMCDKK